MSEKSFVSICSICQKEHPAVDVAVRNTMRKLGIDNKELSFSHGYCLRHFVEVMRENGFADEDIQSRLKGLKGACPDLKEHPELVKLWSAGLFTKAQQAQAQQTQQAAEGALTERLKKLAGIRS